MPHASKSKLRNTKDVESKEIKHPKDLSASRTMKVPIHQHRIPFLGVYPGIKHSLTSVTYIPYLPDPNMLWASVEITS